MPGEEHFEKNTTALPSNQYQIDFNETAVESLPFANKPEHIVSDYSSPQPPHSCWFATSALIQATHLPILTSIARGGKNTTF